ncbi:hypothetical protein IEQ34_001465 [Dendrobium chrysotoxum]|uniref:Uncharacterized protein n=1 Tax=Dendrobium chrysotoxum TaxID=161865 RepID=A0AAV7HQI2_DENCH|nr:hypothetical protein IEQ34_001465 [Dendrobium chrysotoxum]
MIVPDNPVIILATISKKLDHLKNFWNYQDAFLIQRNFKRDGTRYVAAAVLVSREHGAVMSKSDAMTMLNYFIWTHPDDDDVDDDDDDDDEEEEEEEDNSKGNLQRGLRVDKNKWLQARQRSLYKTPFHQLDEVENLNSFRFLLKQAENPESFRFLLKQEENLNSFRFLLKRAENLDLLTNDPPIENTDKMRDGERRR